MNTNHYQKFSDLPSWATSKICKFRPNDAETWIFNPVPALENKSFLDVINQGEVGETQARLYLNDLVENFFPDDC